MCAIHSSPSMELLDHGGRLSAAMSTFFSSHDSGGGGDEPFSLDFSDYFLVDNEVTPPAAPPSLMTQYSLAEQNFAHPITNVRDVLPPLPRMEAGSRVAFRTMSDVEILDDGFKWRKYGRKSVKKSPNPRNYYRCSTEGCTVKKRVERDHEDASYVITTYEGIHNHSSPGVVYYAT